MWPALYAMFCTLMVAIGMGNVSAVLGQSNGLPAGIGDPATNNSITLVLTSLLYGICIIIIPFIAHYVIGGSFAGVAAGVVATAKAGAVIATGGASGAAMGAGGAGGGASGGGGSSGGGVIGGGGSVSVPQSGEGSSTSLPPSRTPASRPPGKSGLNFCLVPQTQAGQLTKQSNPVKEVSNGYRQCTTEYRRTLSLVR